MSDEMRLDPPHPEIVDAAGWGTFEARMRGRRLARCLERARGALAAGATDEARLAVGEARTLAPNEPDIDELERALEAKPAIAILPPEIAELERALEAKPAIAIPPPEIAEFELAREARPGFTIPPPEPDHLTSGAEPGVLRILAAAAALLILFSAIGFGLTQLYFAEPVQALLRLSEESNPTAWTTETVVTAERALPTPTGESASEPRVSSTVQETALPEVAPVPAEQPAFPVEEVTAATPNRPVAAQPPQSSTEGPVAQPASGSEKTTFAERLSAMASGLAPVEPSPTPLLPRAPDASPRSSVEAPPTRPAPSNESPPPTDATPVATSGGPSIASIVAVTSSGVSNGSTPELERIRSVLARYEAAYNRLDAKAATVVWPSVDEPALKRAFNGLLSQRVSLGICDITIVGDIGDASCAGKARWEPKVGGGMETTDRHWTFNLRKTNDVWRIEEIRVR